MKTEESEYSSLQWTIQSNYTAEAPTHEHHNQNMVLAKQCNRDLKLSLQEFITFGTLRAGFRLQYRNLYRALEQESFSLHKKSVFSLIVQSLWQTGVLNGNLWETHIDCREDSFVDGLLDQLRKLVNRYEKMWANGIIMLTLIVIANRVLSQTPSEPMQKKAESLIRRCREITGKQWSSECASKLTGPAETEMRYHYVFSALCTAMTFDKQICVNDEDVGIWINAVTIIHENQLFHANKDMSTIDCNLFRYIRNIGQKLEPTIVEITSQKDSNWLNDYAKRWKGGSEGKFTSWTAHSSPNQQVYYAQWVSNDTKSIRYLQVDVLLGVFLIDSKPLGRLPTTITDNQSFQRLFHTTIFEVLPSGTSDAKFETTMLHHGSRYSFEMMKDELIICQDDEYEYIAPQYFNKEIPEQLETDFCHWWHRIQQTIEFRPVQSSSKQALYLINLNERKLYDNDTQELFVDVQSKSFRFIAKLMKGIELSQHIHVTYHRNTATDEVIVTLPRLSLHFDVASSGIQCKEFGNMVVSPTQFFGACIGLSYGLVLESTVASNNACRESSSTTAPPPHTSDGLVSRKWIVPHSNVTRHLAKESRTVHISLDSFYEPAIFCYDIDARLKRITTTYGKEACLYLALLHGNTSQVLAEPFSGMTGLESAMQILSSAYCQSPTQPYSSAAFHIIKQIAALSPTHKWYPSHAKEMEQVIWPRVLNTLSASEAYYLLCSFYVEQCTRLAALFPPPSYHTKLDNAVDLLEVEYQRTSSFYSPQALVLPVKAIHTVPAKPPFVDVNWGSLEELRTLHHCLTRGEECLLPSILVLLLTTLFPVLS